MRNTSEKYKAYRMVCDIHRRIAKLMAMWTEWDVYGAVVYDLRVFETSAFELREVVEEAIRAEDGDVNLPSAPLPVCRLIKENPLDKYGTFRNHLKGITAALRRLYRNPWFKTIKGGEEAWSFVWELMTSVKDYL